ncbi:MAG: GPR endopeptidase [Clostridia bacterium]|nr:GPR endopeptidase [Clostridia bacterium]
MVRTDLAIEINSDLSGEANGVEREESVNGDVKTTVIKITSEKGEKILGRPCGTYITLEYPDINKIADYSGIKEEIKKALSFLLNGVNGTVLAAGLGNTEITPDSVGPFTAKKILATRHISGQLAESIGLKGLKSVAVITPDVLGKTGIETSELIKSAADTVKPEAVIVIDALAAKDTERLFKTVQMCDTGIRPGSGVKNSRSEISKKTLGVPVIAVGVPTVTDVESIAYSLTGVVPETESGLFVTPKDADLLCDRISEILSLSLNEFLQPEIEPDIIAGLV